MSEFLKREVDPRPLAIVRILTGIASLILFPAKRELLGRIADGHLSIPAVDWAPPVDDRFVTVFTAVVIVASAAMVVGFFSRVASLAVGGAYSLAFLADQQVYSNHVTLLICVALLLGLTDPDGAWSIRSRKKPPQPLPYWPQFLLMTQITSLYAWTALAKINSSFLSGEVLRFSFRAMYPFPDLIFRPLSYVVIATEGFLAVGLWFKRTRPAAFVLGFFLHVSIALFMYQAKALIPFGLISLSIYALFLHDRFEPRRVEWDGNCKACSRWVTFLRSLDWFRLHSFVRFAEEDPPPGEKTPEQRPESAIQVTGPAARVVGLQGIQAVLAVCPPTFLLAPILTIPPFRALGARVYRRGEHAPGCEAALRG